MVIRRLDAFHLNESPEGRAVCKNIYTRAARRELHPRANQIDAFLPIVGQSDWQRVSLDYLGVSAGGTGRDPATGRDIYSLSFPQDGNRVDFRVIKQQGIPLRANLDLQGEGVDEHCLQSEGDNFLAVVPCWPSAW